MTRGRHATDCSRRRLAATEIMDTGDVQATGNHGVGSWRRSANGIAGGVTVWQAAKWVSALDDTDMWD